MRASQRVATPWASKDYCDYSEHCLHTICRSATCFSRTPAVARQYLFRTANGTASSHRQLAAVRRPVSGEAARSGLAEQRAVLCCGGAEQAQQGNTQGSSSSEQAASNHPAQHMHVRGLRPSLLSRSPVSFSPSFFTPSHSPYESFYSSSFSFAPSHAQLSIVTARHARQTSHVELSRR